MSIFSPYSRTIPQQQNPNGGGLGEFVTDQEPSSTMEFGPSTPTSISSSDLLANVDLENALIPKLTPMSSGIEYLNLEDNVNMGVSALPSRSWSDDLCYGAGTAYLSGLGIGGTWGFFEGNKQYTKLNVGKSSNFKLRLNSVLNAMTRRGPFVGNSLGVIALFYTSFYSITKSLYPIDQESERNENDGLVGYFINGTAKYSLSAAAITGLLYRSNKGLVPALKTSIYFTIGMGLYQGFINYRFINQ
ncbi:hypothetical protein BB559_000560 [Furculomyces boomerangus]|uniref:Mitochondrial import inner membrane translocase subunit TIM23 n=2 Tax=Harpellales TaxID=61421 RepID=A0A2T9Z4U7_9FUNG|nr:hypothetical protein BB559_000560 [Furculomyces boomerangus]PWA00965.1 hypothetical protein BB558_002978 [Smittium angustum]